MGILTNKVQKDDIKAGDHIYTYRAAFTYSHHGIFVGSNKVVHFTQSSSTQASRFTFSGMSNISVSCPTSGMSESFSCPTSGMSNIPASCPTSGLSNISVSYPTSYPDCVFTQCGFRQPDSGVVITCLDCFLQNGSPYRCEYGVGNTFLLTRVRGGTCTTAASDPPQTVIHRALYLLQIGFGNYSVLENNCEDFALYCKTGLRKGGPGGGSSGQASNFIGFTLSTSVSYIAKCLVAVGPAGVATLTAGMFCMNRYANDIGVRTDVTKVAVEDVAVKPAGLDSNEGLKESTHPKASQYRKKGWDATGQFQRSAALGPPDMDDESEMENNFDRTSTCDIDEDNSTSCMGSRLVDEVLKKSSENTATSEERRGKSDDAIVAWTEVAKVRTEATLAKTEKYKSTSEGESQKDEFSLTKCIKILEEMQEVDDDTYMKAAEKFKDSDWREIFINMCSIRRRAWLERLI